MDIEAFPGGICQIPLSDTSFSSLLIFFLLHLLPNDTLFIFLTICLHPLENRLLKDFMLLTDQSAVSRTLLTYSKSPENVC